MNNINEAVNLLISENRLILKSIAGSHLYNLNVPSSDLDIRGIFLNKRNDYFTIEPVADEYSDEKSDIKYYSLRKFFNLAKDCNPNIIELLFIPNDKILYKSPILDKIYKKRDFFISKKAYYTFSGYAYSQIKKAKGLNKKANSVEIYFNKESFNEWRKLYKKDKEAVQKIMGGDFIAFMQKEENFVDDSEINYELLNKMKPLTINNFINLYMVDSNGFPFRPMPFTGDVEKHDISHVEGMGNLYRLYKNGNGFIKDNQPVCSSISIERELSDFVGIISINIEEYKKERADFESFWVWMANKNEARYSNCWKKEAQYDCKNMMHTIRLLFSSKNIAINGEPLISFDGKDKDFLMKIRNGEYDYDYLLKFSTDLTEEVKEVFEKSSIPHSANHKGINSLYQEILEESFSLK